MKTIKMVYAGLRLHGDKKTHLYFKVNDDVLLGDRANFKVQIYPCTPGTIFTIEATDDENTVHNNTAKYVGVWRDEEDVRVWQAEHKANNFILQGHRKAQQPGDIDEIVKDLRMAYKLMEPTQRRAFIAWLNLEITK
jgi:hypothetical protein